MQPLKGMKHRMKLCELQCAVIANKAATNTSQALFFIYDSNLLTWYLAAKKGSIELVPGTSCLDILISGDAQGDGEYWIDPTASADPFTVFCDMVTDGGEKTSGYIHSLSIYHTEGIVLYTQSCGLPGAHDGLLGLLSLGIVCAIHLTFASDSRSGFLGQY